MSVREDAETKEGSAEPVRVSPLTVPALLLGLTLGAVFGFTLGPFAAIPVIPLFIVAGVIALLRPHLRESAAAGALGLAISFGGVMILVVIRLIS